MNAEFVLKRTDYRGLTTLGELFKPDGNRLSYTLEDCVRAWGIKDAKRTAIPATSNGILIYRLSLSMSQRFKRIMPIVYTESDRVTLRAGGIEYKGVRMHGANTQEDVEGCIGVARERISDAVLNSLASKSDGDVIANWMIRNQNLDEVIAAIDEYEKKGCDCYLKVINLAQSA